MMEQLEEVDYCHSLTYGTKAAEDLCRLMADSTNGEMTRVFICSSGSEANEAALKLARQYHIEKANPEPSRVHIISRDQSYHGVTLGTLGAGGHVARRKIFEPLLGSKTSRVSPCHEYRGRAEGETIGEYVGRLEAELEAEFQRVGPTTVAAFLAEPVVGAALGCVPPVEGYFQAVRRVCDRHGALLIFDEVMCGAGRIGPEPTERYPDPLHAWQDPLIGTTPDIMTMGKGLGGGYMPVGAMLANKRVMDALQGGTAAFSHGQTYQAHPLACRAASAVQSIIKEENLIANARKMGKLLGDGLQDKLGSHKAVGNIRGKGLFWAIEFVKDSRSLTPYDARDAVASGIQMLALKEPYNISVYPCNGVADGVDGDVVIIAPPYNITREEVQELVAKVTRVVEAFFAEKV